MKTTDIVFDASICVCGKIRHFLRQARSLGKEIKWIEGRGWFNRTWLVWGKYEDVLFVQNYVESLE